MSSISDQLFRLGGRHCMAVAREFDRRMLTKMAFGNASSVSDCYLALRPCYIYTCWLTYRSLYHGGDVRIIVIRARPAGHTEKEGLHTEGVFFPGILRCFPRRFGFLFFFSGVIIIMHNKTWRVLFFPTISSVESVRQKNWTKENRDQTTHPRRTCLLHHWRFSGRHLQQFKRDNK